MIIKEKRAYDAASPEDGFRIYVDRLWPRGLSHLNFHYDLWEKECAPSTELRHWFHEDPEDRWDEFQKKYLSELKANPYTEEFIKSISAHPVITLLYSSKEAEHNNATILKKFLETHLGKNS